MKKLICCALFALVALQAHSQKNDYLSLQLGAGYYYYANTKSSDFYFNYGLSPLLFLNINKLKIGSGVSFATKKYSHNYDVTPTNSISSKLYDINYLNIPIIIGYNVYSKHLNRLDILAGVSFDHFIKFMTTTKYENDDGPVSETDNILEIDKPDTRSGISLLFSLYYYRQLLEQLNVFVSPFAEFKVRSEGDNNPHFRWHFPNNVVTLGLKIGLEFSFKKMKENNK
jgi:hypothetical protein